MLSRPCSPGNDHAIRLKCASGFLRSQARSSDAGLGTFTDNDFVSWVIIVHDNSSNGEGGGGGKGWEVKGRKKGRNGRREYGMVRAVGCSG